MCVRERGSERSNKIPQKFLFLPGMCHAKQIIVFKPLCEEPLLFHLFKVFYQNDLIRLVIIEFLWF